MLEVAFKEITEDVYIQTRYDADLIKISQFKSKTHFNKHRVQKMLFADDSTLIAHSKDMLMLVKWFSKTANHFSLAINIKKTECMYHFTYK